VAFQLDGLGGGLKTPLFKKAAYNGMFDRVSDLDRIFGAT
jgi:hypothetical protein